MAKIDFNSVYIYSDQPATCPKCGASTEILMEFEQDITQIHKCPDPCCDWFFIMQEDLDMNFE